MKRLATTRPAQTFSLARVVQDFRAVDGGDPGLWPRAPRIAVFAGVLAFTLLVCWWFDWSAQRAALERSRSEETRLREAWLVKKRQAANVDEHKHQLAEIDRQFGALLKQLPNRAEMDALLSDINQAGLGRGLQFELFKPGPDVIKDFYAEMPIELRVTGSYHELGEFASDVARMPRIVTLHDVAVDAGKDGRLRLEAKAVTYRYLDEDEIARQRRAASSAQGKRR